KGMLAVNDNCGTNLPNVFAGGDAATMDRYVSVAVGQGKKAAWAIAEHLGYPDVDPLPIETLEDAVQRNEINPFYFAIAAREERGKKPVAERLAGQEDVKVGFSEEQALREAARCMSCGTCIECDNCFIFCSDMAVEKAPDMAEHYRILEQFCKGCGLCAAECPRGCIVMKQESK
ncbi:MAG: 4Fe-4S binding protein, partial [Gaiellales bacterium]|nr:4Fe-4S binding protein [Gaiellales bacterium]